MSTPTSPTKKSHPDNLLFRSRIEICRILQVLAKEHCPIAAEVGPGQRFTAFLLSADPVSDHFAITYCPNKAYNSLLLEAPSVEFTATDHQLHFTFEASSPEETQIEDQPAIQFPLPKTILMHNRREHPRLPLSPETSLRCIADTKGVISFESHITDISHDGLGCLIYDAGIKLDKGTILKGCRIITPAGDAVTADLELRYAAPAQMEDGSLVNRAGFRFLQRPDKIAKLINYFIQDLDKSAKAS